MSRHVRVAEGARHLFDDVVDPERSGAHVGAIGRHHHLQHAIIDAVRCRAESDGCDQSGDVLAAQIDADLALDPGDRDIDLERSGNITTHVEHSVGHLQAGDALLHQLEEAGDRGVDAPGVASALETGRGLGTQSQALRGPGDHHGCEVGRFEQDLGRALGDLGRGAAHDPGDTHRIVLGVTDEAFLAGIAQAASGHTHRAG